LNGRVRNTYALSGHPRENEPGERTLIRFDLEGRYSFLHVSRAEEIQVLFSDCWE